MYLQPVNQPNIFGGGGTIQFQDYPQPNSVRATWGVDETRCNRVYTTRLKVFTTNRYCGPVQIYNSFPVALGSFYQWPLVAGPTENDTGSFLQSVDLEPDPEATDGYQWVATLNYAPFDVIHQLGNSDIGQGIICPTDRAPEIYWTTAKYERAKTEDESFQLDSEGNPIPNSGQPYLNTVGDPLLNPPRIEETRPVLKIVTNLAQYNDAWASQFRDCVNIDEFLTFPPNTVKCADIQPERFYDPDWGYYWRVTFIFEFRYDDDGNGYTNLILNAGYRQLVGGTGTPQQITIGGQPITDAVPLQQDGAYVPTADPYFLEFQDFAQVEFANLNIPDEILQLNS